MSKLIRDNYYQDGLTKHECAECGLEFIVGTDLANGCKNIGCPYCGARGAHATQAVAEMREELLDELGCMGIYYDLTPCEDDLEDAQCFCEKCGCDITLAPCDCPPDGCRFVE